MTTGWTIYVTVISLGLIAACVWLVRWTQKPIKGESQQGDTTGHTYDGIEEYNNPLPRWWLWLFYITIIFALLYFALFGGLGGIPNLLGWTQTGEYEEEMQAAEQYYGPIFSAYAKEDLLSLSGNSKAMATGQRLFVNYCAICHGSDARGSRGFPNLTDDDWLYGDAPNNVKMSIMNGRQGTMPEFRETLGAQGVRELTNYVYSLSGRETDQVLQAAGAQKFQVYCSVCHGPKATGNHAIGAPNLTDKIWLYGGSLATIQETIRNGRGGRMPAHKDFLGNDKVHVLAAYVLSLSAQ